MKRKRTKEAVPERLEIIAVFGEAHLVRVEERIELRGGSMADRTEALEWLVQAMPSEVPLLR